MRVEERLHGRRGKLEHQLDEGNEHQQFNDPWSRDETLTQFVPHAPGHKVQTEDDSQHQAPSAATLKEHGQIGPLKIGEDTADDLTCGMERAGTEKYPQEGHETECQQP